MTSLTITMPIPPACLSPNARCHWRKKAEAAKWCRGGASLKALEQLGRNTPPRWKTATAQAVFYHKQNRRRDGDNALASLKNIFDGLRDAGVIEDDSGLTHLPVVFKVSKEQPRVEITVQAKGASGQ